MEKEKVYAKKILDLVYESFAKIGQVIKLPDARAWIVCNSGGPYDSPCHIFSVYKEAVIVELGNKKWLISLGATKGYYYFHDLPDILAIEFSDGDDPVKLIYQNYEHSHSLVYVEPNNKGEIKSEIKEIRRFLEDELDKHIAKPHSCCTKRNKDGGEVYVLDSTKYNKDTLTSSLFKFLMRYLKNKKP